MGTPIDTRRAVLLGSGGISDYRRVSGFICPEDYIVCVDGGYRHCARLEVVPHLLTGDFDSIHQVPPEDIPRVSFPEEKDYPDTALTVELMLAHGFRRFLLTGMLGGRLDHTLANLQILAWLSGQGADALVTDGLTDAHGLTDGELVLNPHEGCYFSLLCYSQECMGVTIRGAKYALNGHTLRFDRPRAVSNEFIGEPVSISVERGTLIVLTVPME